MTHRELNELLLRVSRRAENASSAVLREAFVPVPALLAQLECAEHQVLFGRRGTGKTHLWRQLRDWKASAGALAVYLDLRQVGMVGDAFSARRDDFAELATGLLVDVIEQFHTQVYEAALTERWSDHLDRMSDALDALADAATQIRVVGETEVERQQEVSATSRRGAAFDLSVGRDPRASWRADSARERSKRSVESRTDRGREAHHVLLGPLSAAFRALAEAVRPEPVWLLVDEWSALPLELQPLLADLLRRTVCATRGIVVKISAIHGRSQFGADDRTRGLVGLELGADTAATLDLDDFLLFRNDTAATLAFHSTLLHRHLTAMSGRVGTVDGPAQQAIAASRPSPQVTSALFASHSSFQMLVANAEGVPRDLLQIAGLAAGLAQENPIGQAHVATATRNYFLRDKDALVPHSCRGVLKQLLAQAMRRRSRIIPLRRDGESDDETIQQLYDARVIHRVRQGLCLDLQHPTEPYDIYVLDTGAFLGLIGTQQVHPWEDGLGAGARFADDGEIEIRGRSFVRLSPRWYRQPQRTAARAPGPGSR